jgi:hypothetical protein
MNRLNVFRMVVSPCPAHAARTDVVGDDIAVVGERFLAEGAYAILQSNLPVEELPHFAVGAEFPVSPGMMRIFNAPNAHLARPFLSWDCFSAAAEERTVNRAQLITAESHGALLIDLGAMTRIGTGRKRDRPLEPPEMYLAGISANLCLV